MALEILDLLNVSNIQTAKTAAFIAAVFINRQALIVLSFHLLGERLFFYGQDFGAYYFCAAACLYALNAVVFIRLSYEIRQALIVIACVNWFAALDYFMFPIVTPFYICYPWVINGLDLFILYVLLSSGGWRRDRIYRSGGRAGNFWRPNLQLH